MDPSGHVVSNAVAPPATGLTPSQLRSAYQLTGTASGGRTVAIVDAYGYPNLARDLATYRSQFGLPACTTSNGCLSVVNETGGTKLPRFNLGWAQEQSLDVDAVSAACPDCRIVVLEANSASFTDLGTAVQTAATLPGVSAISNSYGGSDAADSTYGKYYSFPGIAVTASAGDNGYKGASYPASSSYVTAVGGTSLVPAANVRGWSETVWSGTGSGCSSLNAALPAASADGTSEASPIIASVYALSGNTGSAATGTYANSIPYGHASSLFDVASGSNGNCTPAQWCNARAGWDGPTGLGTPDGVSGF